MTSVMTGRVGFLGLGLMGQPMARKLVDSGTDLLVWNRTAGKAAAVRAAGGAVAGEVDDVFAACPVVVAMLADEPALDAVLRREARGFGVDLAGRTLVSTATVTPRYSAGLEAAVAAAGGRYVEAPVSGSRVPAERGELVAMLAGEPVAVGIARALLTPLCRQTVECGAVPNALNVKLAVNLFLITMVTGLAEATEFAVRSGVDLDAFATVLDAGPMASAVSTVKLAKLVGADYAPQAAAADVLKNCELVRAAARTARAAAPLLDACRDLFAEAVTAGHGAEDMIAVRHAIAERADAS